MVQDLRYGMRMLWKKPGFTAVAVITLALGIGSNTVIFSGVYALLLQTLPYSNADRLAVMTQTSKEGVETGVSYPDFLDWKSQNSVFEQTAVSRTLSLNLTDGDQTERVTGSYVSPELFSLLGGRVLLGRAFLAEEFRTAGEKVVILNYDFWQRRFGEDTGVIGKRLRFDDRDFTVIGVMPQAFQYPFRAAFWMPLEANEKAEALADATADHYAIIGLLKPGVTVVRAAKEMALLARRSAEKHSIERQESSVQVMELREAMPGVRKNRTPVMALQLAVIFVLLIASVNLANLLLARNTERRQEFTIRLALGAGPGRLVRQLLAESLLLGLLGSLLGLVFAFWGMNALRSIVPARMAGIAGFEINAPVLLFTLLVSLLTSLAFGLAPAILASRQDLNAFLRSSAGSAAADSGRRRFSRALMTAEVALAVALLAAAGLMMRTFLNMTQENPGFKPDHALAVKIELSSSQYPDHASLAGYYNEAIGRIEAMPGVEAVGGVTYLPLIGYNPGTDFTIESRAVPSPDTVPRADFQPITPGYFEAMGIPLIRGRLFTDADLKPAPDAAIINQALAKKFWPEEDPLGKQIQLQGEDASPIPMIIAGIVGDVKQFGLHTDPRPEIYLPMHRPTMTLIVRTRVSPTSLFPALREAVGRLDSKAAFSIKTMEQVVADSMDKRRIFALLLGVFAAVALVMAALGIYGVISYLAAQRTREIGIRLALGAVAADVRRLVLRQAMKLVAIGLGLGLLGSLVITRLLSSLLYGVSATDPITMTGVSALLFGVALVACYLPARRASKVDPIIALRCD